jgi:hypothetical protein
MAQVAGSLPRKHNTLGSNPSTVKKQKKTMKNRKQKSYKMLDNLRLINPEFYWEITDSTGSILKHLIKNKYTVIIAISNDFENVVIP